MPQRGQQQAGAAVDGDAERGPALTAGLWIAFDVAPVLVSLCGWMPLPLHPLHALLPLDRRRSRRRWPARPGSSGRALDGCCARGAVRRSLRGVYAASAASDALEVRLPRSRCAVGRTPSRSTGRPPGCTASRDRRQASRAPCWRWSPGRVGSSDAAVGGLRALRAVSRADRGSPVDHAAADGAGPRPAAASGLAPGAMDGLLAARAFTMSTCSPGLTPVSGTGAIGQLRYLAAQVDARRLACRVGAADALAPARACRPRCLDGRAPSGRLVRLTSGVDVASSAPCWPTVYPADPSPSRTAGGRRTREAPVLRARTDSMDHAPRAEFHQHLLAQTEAVLAPARRRAVRTWTNQRCDETHWPTTCPDCGVAAPARP